VDENEESTYGHEATEIPSIVCGVYHVPFCDMYLEFTRNYKRNGIE
jgi:hypothetical protein